MAQRVQRVEAIIFRHLQKVRPLCRRVKVAREVRVLVGRRRARFWRLVHSNPVAPPLCPVALPTDVETFGVRPALCELINHSEVKDVRIFCEEFRQIQ